MSQIRQNFIYPKEIEQHRKYGANFLSLPVVKPDLDWRKVLSPHEEQRRHGVEPSTCYIFAQTNANATYEEGVFGELDNDYSERAIAVHSKGTPQGGDPLKAADAIYDYGLVKESLMPFTEDIKSWDEYHSWKGADKNKVLEEGEKDKLIKDRRSSVLFSKDAPLETKYRMIEEALKRGLPCISVWGVAEGDTYAIKPKGVRDTHMVQVVFLDKTAKQLYIKDTYPPFIKVLPPNYNPDYGQINYVFKKTPVNTKDNWLVDMCKRLWGFVVLLFK